MRKLLLPFVLFFASILGAQTAPESFTAYVGQKVELKVTAQGTAPFTYAWYKGANVITAATTDTLLFNGIQLTDAGSYKVVLSNFAGSAESQTVALVVIQAVAPSNVKITITILP
jgi:hypothetical protein